MSSQNLQVEYKREVHGLKSNKITHDKKDKMNCCSVSVASNASRPEVIKKSCSIQLSMKFILLMNVKMPTFISRIYTIQSTLVNSTMHNSILSLISTRWPGPGIFPYILLQFDNVYLDNG